MHDAIVVGARCAGAATAMLLARQGYKVALVDRSAFPSDIPHGHFIHRHGPPRLARWGLLDAIARTNCPPVTSSVMDLGDFPLIGTELAVDGIALGYGPRRSVVDTILVEAAGNAGADVRTGVNVDGFTTDDGRITGIRGRRTATGQAFSEAATLVIGADGRRSRLARAVAAPEYDTVPALTCWYFSYWSGVPDRGAEIYIRPDRVAFAFPTNDGLAGVFVGWPAERLPTIRADIGRHFLAALDGLFDLGQRVRAGRREEPFKGTTDVPNFFRKPYGAGWALVGDAGCHKDPVLALGMCDALRDAELLADAVDRGLSGRHPLTGSLQEYERRRNEASAEDYRENLNLASFQPMPAETYRLRDAIRHDADATRRFFLARQGRLPPQKGRGTVRRAVPRALAAWVCAALLLCAPAVARAQARPAAAEVSGRVTDESGAVLPDAIVTIVNTDTRISRTVRTDADGGFDAPALPPGPYRIIVERAGFAPRTVQPFDVLVGQSATHEIVMAIAGRADTVTVAGGMSVSRDTAVSASIGSRQIDTLPINGRNFISFSVITPAVVPDRTAQQGALVNSGLSFAGQRARSNNIMVDGLDNNDIVTGSVRATFSQDAIREFQVLANSYSAEFGQASGGVVNIVTKSGADTARGSAFGYYRDEALNAKDYFERFDRFGTPIDREKAPFSQTQWGGTAGGPLRRQRTFFFASFERSDARANNFVTIDERAARILGLHGFPVELGDVPYALEATEGLARIDHQFSPASTLVLRANASTTTNENIEPFGGIVARSRGAVQLRDDWSLAASHTGIIARRWVNEARLQVARDDVRVLALDPACAGPCDGALEGGPTIELPGIASVGRQRFTPQTRKNDRYQLVETVSLLAGSHALKAGVEVNHLRNSRFELALHFGGRFIFADLPAIPALGILQPMSSLQALERGIPAAYIQGYGRPTTDYTYNELSLFVQDEWQIGRRVTVRPGMRYQRQFWPEARYAISNVGGSRLEYAWPQDRNDLAPRVSVAFDPTGSGRTSLSAAYGHYYERSITGNVAATSIVNGQDGVRTLAVRLPLSMAAWNAPGHRLPEPSAPFPSVEIAIDPGLETPFAHHAAVGVDHEFARGLTASADLVIARGRHQLGTIDYNPIVPALGPARRPNDSGGVAGTSASVLQYTSFGQTWYTGVALSLRKALRQSHQFQLSYTLSTADDTTTDFHSAFLPERNGAGRNPANPTGLPLGFDPLRERGPSTQDQRHRFVLSGVWQLPFEIQAAGILTAASGRPFTPLAGADLNGDGDGGAFPPDRARRVPSDPDTSVARNSETMPAQVVADVRVSKRWAVTDGIAVTALVEVFNLLNRANFSEVNNVFGRGAFPGDPARDAEGRVSYGRFEQALPPRQVQLALRLTF